MALSSATKRKKTAVKKAAGAPGPPSPSVEKLSTGVDKMTLNKSFSMDFKLPYILVIFNEGLDSMTSIEILTLSSPDIISGGRKFELRIQLPDMFTDEARVSASNDGVAGFNKNTHKAQAFRSQCEAIDEHFGFAPSFLAISP